MVRSSRRHSTSTCAEAATTALVVLLALAAAACGPRTDEGPLAARSGRESRYVIGCRPCVEPIPLHRLHCWDVAVRTPDGAPVEDAIVRIDGGMPSHGHGLPTVPTPGEPLGDGAYRVEGMKFQMPGHWRIEVSVEAARGADVAVFELDLE